MSGCGGKRRRTNAHFFSWMEAHREDNLAKMQRELSEMRSVVLSYQLFNVADSLEEVARQVQFARSETRENHNEN